MVMNKRWNLTDREGWGQPPLPIVSLNEKFGRPTIPMGQIPCALAVNPATGKGSMPVNYGDETLTRDRPSLRSGRIATLPVGHHPQAVALDPIVTSSMSRRAR